MPVGASVREIAESCWLEPCFIILRFLIFDELTNWLDPAIDASYDAIKQEGDHYHVHPPSLWKDGVVDSIGIISEGRILISDAVDKLLAVKISRSILKGKFKPDHIKELRPMAKQAGICR